MMKFLHGLFTTHVVTKVVSLLLASVLFVFTQQSISDEQTIDELTITFKLAPDLEQRYVLDNEQVVLKQLKVSGLRRDLAVEIGSLRRADFVITKVVTEQFIRDYRPDNSATVVIDADLLRAEALPWDFGQDFQLELKRPGKLEIERLRDVTFRPVLSDAMKAELRLPESSAFRAADGSLQIDPEWVQPNGAAIGAISISGPSSLLPQIDPESNEVPPLYIRVPNLAEILRGRTLAEAREPIKISEIMWSASGIGDPSRLYVRAPLSESPKSLEKATLHFRCDLKLTPTRIQVTLPFAFSTRGTGELTLAAFATQYSYLGRKERSRFDAQPSPGRPITEWTEVVNLDLEVAATWKDREADLKKLFFLEIDIANAAKVTEKRLEVPLRLKPRNAEAERVLDDGEVMLPDPLAIFQSE
jgi:hypothetical protein